MPLTSQVTDDVDPPVTVAVNCWFCVVATEAVNGASVIVTFVDFEPPPHAIRNASNKKTSRTCNCLIFLLRCNLDECPWIAWNRIWDHSEY